MRVVSKRWLSLLSLIVVVSCGQWEAKPAGAGGSAVSSKLNAMLVGTWVADSCTGNSKQVLTFNSDGTMSTMSKIYKGANAANNCANNDNTTPPTLGGASQPTGYSVYGQVGNTYQMSYPTKGGYDVFTFGASNSTVFFGNIPPTGTTLDKVNATGMGNSFTKQ